MYAIVENKLRSNPPASLTLPQSPPLSKKETCRDCHQDKTGEPGDGTELLSLEFAEPDIRGIGLETV